MHWSFRARSYPGHPLKPPTSLRTPDTPHIPSYPYTPDIPYTTDTPSYLRHPLIPPTSPHTSDIPYTPLYPEQACRTEAEYAYQLRKTIVPVKCSRYEPDGWLGTSGVRGDVRGMWECPGYEGMIRMSGIRGYEGTRVRG